MLYKHTQSSKINVFIKIWTKQNFCALFDKNSIVPTLGNSEIVSQKQNRSTTWSTVTVIYIYPKNWKQRLEKINGTLMFPLALFTIAQRSNEESIYQRMDKQNVAYAYNGILFSLKKEENSDMHESLGHTNEWNKVVTHDKYHTCITPLLWSILIHKIHRDRK